MEFKGLNSYKVIKQSFHEKKVKAFSGADALPKGQTSGKLIPGCMVLEGGAFRGIYGEGVLDALMEEDICLQTVIGTSAGAMNGMNYASGQIGRSARVNLTYRHDSRYVGTTALRHNHGLIGFDFVFDKDSPLIKEDPFNEEYFFRPELTYIAVATNCLTGKAEYFNRDTCGSIMKAIQASASMPYVSQMVDVDGIPCLDGGCACKIPYEWALEQGYEKIVVIRTRDYTYRKKVSEHHPAKKFYRHYPEFAEALDNSSADYNRQCEEIHRLGEEGRLFVISPSRHVTVGRVENDMEKLGELYYLGYRDGKRSLEELKKYLVQ